MDFICRETADIASDLIDESGSAGLRSREKSLKKRCPRDASNIYRDAGPAPVEIYLEIDSHRWEKRKVQVPANGVDMRPRE
jgi:hypothetical protein